MGVYIKGMEMPESCQSCFANEYQTCIFADKNASVNGKLPDCPLVPVPPHGRLIDADKIEYVQSENGCLDDYAYRYDINEMPTIIPAEEGET